MVDFREVIEQSEKYGYPATAQWVRDNQVAYCRGISQGFKIEEEPEGLDAEKGSGEIPMRGELPDEPIPDVT